MDPLSLARRTRNHVRNRISATTRKAIRPRAAILSRTTSSETLEQLQQELLRLEVRLGKRLASAFGPLLGSPRLAERREATGRLLGLWSSALDIAIASNPQLALFDMIAFLDVSLRAARVEWIPKHFGSRESEILTALTNSLAEAWQLTRIVLTEDEAEKLAAYVREWADSQPDLHSAEILRLSKYVAQDDATHGSGLSGLLRNARSAVEKADAARLLAERSLHYAQQAPFLMRLQARATMLDLLYETSLLARPLGSGAAIVAGVASLLGILRWSILRSQGRKAPPSVRPFKAREVG